MEEKTNDLMVSMGLMFAYLGRYNHYDQLLKNEGKDKYIISIVHLMTMEEIVDVFRVSEIKNSELRNRISYLDGGYPLVNTCKNGTYIYSYLSEVKELTESVGGSVRELLKNK